MARQQYAVIGLGRFGTAVARRLHEAGHEVLGMDVNEDRVEDAELYVTHAAIGDSTEEKTLIAIGIRNFDCAIVAIGNDIQSSILTAQLLKELGVKKVIAKALGKQHGKVLEKVGVDWIIYPERDMGERVANQLLSPNILNYIELSREYSIEEILTPPGMAEKSIQELDIRAKYNISVIAIVSGTDIIVSPSPDQIIHKGDLLVVIGDRESLARFSSIE
jgi:trk system potassium uptake protein TrkA